MKWYNAESRWQLISVVLVAFVILVLGLVLWRGGKNNEERSDKFDGGLRISADIPEEKVGIYGDNEEAGAKITVWVNSLSKKNFVFSQTLNISEDGSKAEDEIPLDPGFYWVYLRYNENIHQKIYPSTTKKIRVPREGETWIELHYQKQEQRIFTDEEISELREEKKKQEEREQTIEGFKKDLAVFKGQKRLGDFVEEKVIPFWELTIRYGQRMAGAMTVCEAHQRLMRGRYIIGALREENAFTTETIGTNWTELLTLERKISLDTARGLLFLLKNPVERSKCGRGKGQFFMDNQDEMIEQLVWVMEGIGLQPRDIGTTPMKIREIIRKRVKKEISKLKPQLKGSNSAWAGKEIEAFLDEYKFTPREVGLTPFHLALIEKVKKSQK